MLVLRPSKGKIKLRYVSNFCEATGAMTYFSYLECVAYLFCMINEKLMSVRHVTVHALVTAAV